jgi:ribosomal protein S18 acetylase RimI-like enzyme
MKIRSFCPDDAPRLLLLWGDVFGYEEARNDPEFVLDSKLAQDDDLLIVAVEGADLIGSIMAGFDGHRGWLYRLAVSPQARRNRTGERLVAEAEARLAARGCAKVNLQTHAGNDRALRFWQAAGYRVEERVSLGKEISGAPLKSNGMKSNGID